MPSKSQALREGGEQPVADRGTVVSSPWQPRIIAFVCNWRSYVGADLTGTSRIEYPASVRIVRVPCSGRVDPVFILRSFQRGADGVLVCGCPPGDCHHGEGNFYARRRMMMFRSLLRFVGIDPRRVQMSWVSAREGREWAQLVTDVTEEIKRLGPFRDPGFADARDSGERTTRSA